MSKEKQIQQDIHNTKCRYYDNATNDISNLFSYLMIYGGVVTGLIGFLHNDTPTTIFGSGMLTSGTILHGISYARGYFDERLEMDRQRNQLLQRQYDESKLERNPKGESQ